MYHYDGSAPDSHVITLCQPMIRMIDRRCRSSDSHLHTLVGTFVETHCADCRFIRRLGRIDGESTDPTVIPEPLSLCMIRGPCIVIPILQQFH